MKWSEMTPKERDALVAEKVMGFPNVHKFRSRFVYDNHHEKAWVTGIVDVPNYTTSILDAWSIVEKLQEFYLDFDLHHFDKNEQRWMCQFVTPLKNVKAFAGTAQEAICIAALLVFDIQVE